MGMRAFADTRQPRLLVDPPVVQMDGLRAVETRHRADVPHAAPRSVVLGPDSTGFRLGERLQRTPPGIKGAS